MNVSADHRSCISIIVLCFLLFLPLGCKKHKIYKKGDPAPPMAVKDLSGEELLLTQFPQKAKILVFWQEACCSDQLPVNEKIYQKHSGDLVVIGINTGDSAKTVKRVVDSLNIGFPNGIDQMRITADRFGIRATPTYYLIDANNVIQDVIIGSAPSSLLNERVKALLAR